MNKPAAKIIKRYGHRYLGGGDYEWEGLQENGEYCQYSDYEELQEEHSRLVAAERRGKELLERLFNVIEAECRSVRMEGVDTPIPPQLAEARAFLAEKGDGKP